MPLLLWVIASSMMFNSPAPAAAAELVTGFCAPTMPLSLRSAPFYSGWRW
jgi:hypothetical protein